MVDRGSSGIEIQGVDLDVPQERRPSAITWATGAGATVSQFDHSVPALLIPA